VTCLNASAGISYCKFLAKLASDQRKPNGRFVIPPERGEAFIAALPVKKFHGVGPKTAERMNGLGIFTGADLRAQPLSWLQQHFGKSGAWYYAISRGQDDRPVNPNRIRKSSGSETTFKEELVEPSAIEDGVRSMADEVWVWCEKTGEFGRTVTVKIKYADFQIATRSRTSPAPVQSHNALRAVSVELVRSVFPPVKGIRLLGVAVSGFERGETPAIEQLGLGLQSPHLLRHVKLVVIKLGATNLIAIQPPECKSASGLEADQRGKRLIELKSPGLHDGSDLHSAMPKSSARWRAMPSAGYPVAHAP